jgi:7,8-dihydroneopterin aldolase/epimerase/oxygenase
MSGSTFSDIVYITGLKVHTTIGVFDWERAIKQPLTFDIEIEHCMKQAAQTDDVQFAIDYSAVSDLVRNTAESSDFKLIESLAEQIAQQIIQQFKIISVKIKLSKAGAVSGTKDVGIIIKRFSNISQP